MDRIALGTFIRTRREALQPEDVGLRRRSRRRTAGLRCEEVADLSDMFADYLARLERGAGPQPSTQMIGALARGLRLTIDERDHLLLLAGHVVPARGGSGGHVSPGLMRILDRLADTPAQVVGPLGETLAQNTTGHRPLRGRVRFIGPARSAAYRWFVDPSSRPCGLSRSPGTAVSWQGATSSSSSATPVPDGRAADAYALLIAPVGSDAGPR